MSEPLSGEGSASAPSTIVVGYSPKPEGRAALQRAIDEARLRGSSLIVVHSIAGDEIAALERELAGSGVPYEIQATSEALDPAEELIAAASTSDAEFIVIGLRKRSPVGKLLLGSNAQRVLLDASCPVLAVKPLG
ncbi:MAG TPA: universal stress protein [Microlunatus sp.]|jgi:nucleotide-binding universal stress UspA family protein|nr:universal stress protein [Microlunatus sp.]